VTQDDEIQVLRRALAETQQRLQSVIDVAGGPMCTMEFELQGDAELVFVRADAAAQRHITVADPAFYGRRLLEVIVGMAGTPIPAQLLDVARHGRAMPTTAFVPPGTRLGRPFLMFAFQSAPGRAVLKLWESYGAEESEEVRRRNQTLLTQFFQDSPVAIAVTRAAEGTLVDVNAQWSRLTGWPRNEVLGRSPAALGLWAGAAPEHDWGDPPGAGQARPLEWPLRTRAGDERVVSLHAARIQIGGAEHHLAYLVDVTARRRAEDLLRERETVLLQAQHLARLGSWRWHGDSDEGQWSDETYRLFGVDPAHFVVNAANFMALIHPEDRAAIDRAQADALAGVRPYDLEYRVLTPAGELRHLHGRASVVPGEAPGQPVTMLGTVLDITQRKAAEQALLLRDSALRTSLNAVAMSDLQGRLNYVNDAFVALWGLDDPGQALGRPVDSFWADPAQSLAVVAALRQGAGTWRGELVGRRRDGSRFDVATWATLATEAGGRPIGMLASFLDITERKRAETELQQLNATLDARVQERTRELEAALAHLQQAQDELVRREKLAALGALVAGLAHELNTPVGNAVMVSSTLAGRQQEFEAALAGGLRRSTLDAFLGSTREITAVLERNLHRAAELIGSFKQIAVDQSSYQRRRFEAAEVVQEIALALSPTLRRSRVVLVDETPTGLVFDSYPGPLGQVLINLVNNAVVHAFDGGAAGRVRIGAAALDPGHVRLWVADDGRGIPPEHLRQVFDPFFTTRLGQGGSGLGMHIVYTLVTGLLGGRIDVQSTPGRGTRVQIDLPRVAAAAASA